MKSKYDIAIIGSGHNGLIAACYLAKAGFSVLMLEKNDHIGGATYSRNIFEGIDAYISEYSYLISLLPQKIIKDLGISFATKQRIIASFTPEFRDKKLNALVIRNDSQSKTEKSFHTFTSHKDYKGYLKLLYLEQILASKIWPTMLSPLKTRAEMKKLFKTKEEQFVWDAFINEPLGTILEKQIKNDALRGLLFTDAKIGVHTYPHDPSFLQNRTFLYHVIGNGTGEWRVPVGGMGKLSKELSRCTVKNGVDIRTSVSISSISPGKPFVEVAYTEDGKKYTVGAKFLLSNAAPAVLRKLMDETLSFEKPKIGSVFKINMLLKKLPQLKIKDISSIEAFTGTFHLHEGYEEMEESYNVSLRGKIPACPPGEMYCHSLTDDSILSKDLRKKGYVTLTLFGLDMPYPLFSNDHKTIKQEITEKYLNVINEYLIEPIQDCLAQNKKGELCLEAKSPLDLENELAMPYGNIFHGDLLWPFVEEQELARTWGVETEYDNIFICGAGARRGGAVSGIPGYNAAMKVFQITGKNIL